MGTFLQRLCSSGRPLYALPVSMNLSLRTLDGYLVADGFFHQCSQVGGSQQRGRPWASSPN
jgi:hypothetical protein